MVSKITALMLALILTTLPLTGLAEHSKGDVRRAWRALARRLTVRQRLKWLIRRCLSGSVSLED